MRIRSLLWVAILVAALSAQVLADGTIETPPVAPASAQATPAPTTSDTAEATDGTIETPPFAAVVEAELTVVQLVASLF